MTHDLSLCLMGASTDTGNLGVSALCLSVLRAIARRAPGASVTVFDNGRGEGAAEEVFDGEVFRFRRAGLNDSRRFYRRDSLWNVSVSSRLGWTSNPSLRALCDADAVLDITGGDSFTDLYGPRRFWSGIAAKRLALRLSGGLVLLPQTFGPFRDPSARAAAAEIVRGARMAVARDAASMAVLVDLAGNAFDAARHREGVDVAFALGASEPPRTAEGTIEDWTAPGRAHPVVGVNVSGLLYMDPPRAQRDYGLACDYRAAIHGLLGALLERTAARVVLVPHVLVPAGHFESDRDACCAALDALPAASRRRVVVAPDMRAGEAKGLISRMDWFCGTRMHSAIAALSSGVPASAFAYSGKTHGVFETCGMGAHVADLRTLAAPDAVEIVWRSWERRVAARVALAEGLRPVLSTAARQMDEIIAVCRALQARRRRPVPLRGEAEVG